MPLERVASRHSYSLSADLSVFRLPTSEPRLSLEVRPRSQKEIGCSKVSKDSYHHHKVPQDSHQRWKASQDDESDHMKVPQDDYHHYCRYFSSTNKNRDAPLLRLPTEIRCEIFRYLLPRSAHTFRLYTDCDSDIVGIKHTSRRPKVPDPYSLAILRTNRQIYLEALSVLYSENLFHFVGFNRLQVLEFIRRLSPDARDMVRKVRLTLLTDPQGRQNDKHDLLCSVIHDYFPFLTMMRDDPRIWF